MRPNLWFVYGAVKPEAARTAAELAKVKVKERIAVKGTPVSQLRDVTWQTCHTESPYLPPDTSEHAPS